MTASSKFIPCVSIGEQRGEGEDVISEEGFKVIYIYISQKTLNYKKTDVSTLDFFLQMTLNGPFVTPMSNVTIARLWVLVAPY